MFFVALLCIGLIAGSATEAARRRGPVMGFSTWNQFGCDIDENLVLDLVDRELFMASYFSSNQNVSYLKFRKFKS